MQPRTEHSTEHTGERSAEHGAAQLEEENETARWRAMLTGDDRENDVLRRLRRIFKRLPSAPRCKLCYAPYGAPFGPVVSVLGYGPWSKNPSLCGSCFTQLEKNMGGAEVTLSLLFADIRDSTRLAERLPAATYRKAINAFYRIAARHVNDGGGVIDKYLGDGVFALFLPGFSGQDHARRALDAGRELLADTLDSSDLPAELRPLPVGVGVHTGIAYVGMFGQSGDVLDFTAIGDGVNLTQRLSSAAGPRELLISEETRAAAALPEDGLEKRELELKGIDRPVTAWLSSGPT